MEDCEQWKWVDGFRGEYEVSDLGNIRSHKGLSPRILKPRYKRDGYVYVWLGMGSRSCQIERPIHVMVAEAFIQNPENKPTVNHKNGIRDDNRAVNLEWVTQRENVLDGIRRNPHRDTQKRLTDEQREAIRKDTRTVKEIAEEYGFSLRTIIKVRNTK